MKKFENLGRSLSKQEQKKIKGGYEDPGGGGVRCKTATSSCTYVTITGGTIPGTCGDTVTPPMQTTQCGCKAGDNIQPASECDNAQ